MPGPPATWYCVMRPGEGTKVHRVLGVDAALDRVPALHDVALAVAQLQARGHADLLLHDVDAGDHLGHRVLDLHARVHLDEVELVVLVEELEGAGAAVADLAAGVRAALADALDEARLDAGRRRLLDDLLVAALHRAVALAEVDRAACARRRAPGSRCGAGSRGTSRGRRWGCRRRSAPRCASCSPRSRARPRCARRACRARRRRRRP